MCTKEEDGVLVGWGLHGTVGDVIDLQGDAAQGVAGGGQRHPLSQEMAKTSAKLLGESMLGEREPSAEGDRARSG